MKAGELGGVWVPVLTPFTADLEPDRDRHARLCRDLLADGADGLAVFGTTSEANSMSPAQRMRQLDGLIAAGIPAERTMPGTGACAIDDAVALTRHAVRAGASAVLMLPPFYYKGVSDDGLFRFVAEVIERVGDDRLQLLLYHIPPVAQVGFSPALVGRLVEAFPGTVVGIKDSSGDWDNTATYLREFPQLRIFPGSEVFLLDGLRAGGAGCITATGNVNAAGIRRVYADWRGTQADGLQAEATRIRKLVQTHPMVPALKRIVATVYDDEGWALTCPPMQPLGEAASRALLDSLAGTALLRARAAQAAA
ncbi:MAG: dihydrodipicolinate synthase family protein [Alphaproteobacteria bacterium]